MTTLPDSPWTTAGRDHVRPDVGGPRRRPRLRPDREGALARQARRESSARTYARHLQMVPVHAQGMVLTGADGRRYLDCLSGAGTLALGHNHPVVVEAVQRVIRDGAPWHALDVATPEKDTPCTSGN